MINKLISILVIVCLAWGAENNNKFHNNKASAPKENDRMEQDQGRGRQFPGFNTEGTVLPPSPGPGPGPGPGFQDEGLFQGPFNPYASPQLGYPGFYPNIQPQQGYPIQPQILYYSGAGQPFLVNPGNPPGNFLVPQSIPGHQPQQPIDPNIFHSQPQPQPGYPQQNPVFIGGFPNIPPKQPHIPPIEKDAEEIPVKTTPQQAVPSSVPAIPGIGNKKPQKIELDDENEDEANKSPQHPVNPNVPVRNFLNLRPGQRFFILNGQPLFNNYQHLGYQNPGFPQNSQIPERFIHQPQPYIVRPTPQNFYPQQQNPTIPQEPFKSHGSLANIILRNQPQVVQQHIIPPQFKGHQFHQQPDGLPLTLHNQVIDKGLQSVVLSSAPSKDVLQSRYYEKGIPLEHHQREDEVQPIFEVNAIPGPVTGGLPYDYFKYGDASEDSGIIIDAKYQEPNEVDDDEVETEKPAESSVAEAQPGAIALAGEGGVAAAGPRGTALAGEGGLAVSSPHATAVAGPAKDDPRPVQQQDEKKKGTMTKPTK